MNNADFKRVVALADSNVDLEHHDIDALHGCGLPGFQPVTVTIETAARHLRWQAKNLNGTWDSEAMAETQRIFRYKVQLAN